MAGSRRSIRLAVEVTVVVGILIFLGTALRKFPGLDEASSRLEFLPVAGQLAAYKVEGGGRKSTKVDFTLSGRSETFWTRAVAPEQLQRMSADGPVHVRFFVTNPPLVQGPYVKAWGLWLNETQMRSLDAEMADEEMAKRLLIVFSWGAYGAAVVVLGLGLRVLLGGRR